VQKHKGGSVKGVEKEAGSRPPLLAREILCKLYTTHTQTHTLSEDSYPSQMNQATSGDVFYRQPKVNFLNTSSTLFSDSGEGTLKNKLSMRKIYLRSF